MDPLDRGSLASSGGVSRGLEGGRRLKSTVRNTKARRKHADGQGCRFYELHVCREATKSEDARLGST